MSYVIQNFSDSTRKITLTPRFKFFFILNNLEKFFILFKLNTFLNTTFKINFFKLNYFFIFFKYFFSKQFVKLIYQLDLNYLGNYTNNLTKSFVFYIFYNLNNFFKLNYLKININVVNKTLLFNLYYFSIKTLNIKINSTFYKNIFFYFMLINSFL